MYQNPHIDHTCRFSYGSPLAWVKSFLRVFLTLICTTCLAHFCLCHHHTSTLDALYFFESYYRAYLIYSVKPLLGQRASWSAAGFPYDIWTLYNQDISMFKIRTLSLQSCSLYPLFDRHSSFCGMFAWWYLQNECEALSKNRLQDTCWVVDPLYMSIHAACTCATYAIF